MPPSTTRPAPAAAATADRRSVARAVGATWIFGATLLLLMAFVLRRDPQAHDALFAAVAAVATVVGLVLVVSNGLPRRTLEACTFAGSLLVALTVVASADATGPYAFFYVWITVQAFAVVPVRRIAPQVALVTASYLAAFAATGAHDSRGVAAVMILGTVAATGAFAAMVRGQRERFAASVAEAEQRDPHRDRVTGLLRAETLHTAFALEIARASRGGHELSLIVFGLDGVEAIEERYGADARDEVLAAAARALGSSCRLTDVAVRSAERRFAVLLPETDGAGASLAAARLRRMLSEVELVGEAGDEQAPGRLTASIGIATYREHGISAESMTAAAQQALVSASAHGGDRAEVAPATAAI